VRHLREQTNSCRLFPIEQRDIQELRGSCSYYFIEKPVRLGKATEAGRTLCWCFVLVYCAALTRPCRWTPDKTEEQSTKHQAQSSEQKRFSTRRRLPNNPCPRSCSNRRPVGDEGKGKIVDCLGAFRDRDPLSGRHNAGHSVQVGDKSFVLHLLPSVLSTRERRAYLAMAWSSIRRRFRRGRSINVPGYVVSPERVKISSRAHLILPYHRALDHTSEERLGNEKVGPRCAALVPHMKDKQAAAESARRRHGADVLRSRIERNLEDANRIIDAYGATSSVRRYL